MTLPRQQSSSVQPIFTRTVIHAPMVFEIIMSIMVLLVGIAMILLIAWGYKKDYEKSPRYFKAALKGPGRIFLFIMLFAALLALLYGLFIF